jgi:glycosyltransferase involved in cell wall biosynthesis
LITSTLPAHTLYLCYFGLREGLVQTQVLPYLRQISASGYEVTLLTFEPDRRQSWTQLEVDQWQARLKSDGIRWLSLSYHKRPSIPATLYDIIIGSITVVRLARRHGIHVLHARTHVPMLMAMIAQPFIGCPLVFDFRGLLAEEYADANIWAENSLLFRAVKILERIAFHRASQIVVLTERMREWLIQQKLAEPDKIQVIPCCVDFTRFDNTGLDESETSTKPFEVVYAGSVTGLYLLEEMGRFFLEIQAQRPDAFFRILTPSSHQKASAILQRLGISPDNFSIGAVSPSEVPLYLRGARLGLSFRKPTFSQIAASPTKIPEYLAAGLPVVSNAGTGDIDSLLKREKVGVIVERFDGKAYAEAVKLALALTGDPNIRKRCLETARRHFDLIGVGGKGYRNVYSRLENRKPVDRCFES